MSIQAEAAEKISQLGTLGKTKTRFDAQLFNNPELDAEQRVTNAAL